MTTENFNTDPVEAGIEAKTTVLDPALAAAIEPKYPLYDASAHQSFPHNLNRGDKKYATVFNWKPVDEEAWFTRDERLKVTGQGDFVEDSILEENVRLFDATIDTVTNCADLSRLHAAEKDECLAAYLAVSIHEAAQGKALNEELPAETERVIKTEAWFNGFDEDKNLSVQTHFLRLDPDGEFKKEYNRIRGKVLQQEQTRGLRGKPKIEYRSQTRNFVKLYQKLVLRTEGFAGGIVPGRFALVAVHNYFADTVEEGKK
jgi:hypothetical protein